MPKMPGKVLSRIHRRVKCTSCFQGTYMGKRHLSDILFKAGAIKEI